MSKDKHKVAEMVEAYGDYFLVVLGVIGALSAVGGFVVQLFPAYGASGLIDLAAEFWTLNSNTITNGAAIGSLAPVAAYGTNQALDSLKDVQDAWKETEFAAFVIAFALPTGYQVMGLTFASGDALAQGVFGVVYFGSLSHLVDL